MIIRCLNVTHFFDAEIMYVATPIEKFWKQPRLCLLSVDKTVAEIFTRLI